MLLDKIDEALGMLADNPLLGTLQDRYRPNLRSFVVGNYVIFYMPIEDGIEVQRVLHGARQIEDLL